MKKIIIFTRCTSTFKNFRLPLVDYLSKQNDISVIVCMTFLENDIYLIKKKFPSILFLNVNFLNSKRYFIIKEIATLWQIFKILLKNPNSIINNFTIKPVLYVSLINIFFKNRLLNTITGLGHLFFKNNLKLKVIKFIYNFALLNSDFVIFQNHQDKKKLIYNLLRKKIKTKIILPDLKFTDDDLIKYKNIKKSKKIIFLMFCRLIKEKGISEYIEAAISISKMYKNNQNIIFKLVGAVDLNNPSSFTKSEINSFKKNKIKNIIIEKKTENILSKIQEATVIVHPSYGEGMPASILEGMYCSKPIITTSVSGCKELVKHLHNGILIRPRNIKDLTKAMLFFINNKNIITKFGKNSKILLNKKFKKNGKLKYLELYKSL